MSEEKLYCGIVFIGTGSSWAYGDTPEKAAKAAAKLCRRDWGRLFKLDDQPIKVNVIDMTDHEGWFADHRGIYADGTDEPIEVIAKLVIVP